MLSAPSWITGPRLQRLRYDYIFGMVLAIAAGACCILGIGGPYGTSLFSAFLFYATATLGWCLQAGYGGMFSLAPAATMMIAAYASALASNAGYPMALAVVSGVAAGGLTGLVVALATSRLKGHYFALATLIAAEIVRLVVTNEYDLTGGEAGLRTAALVQNAKGWEIGALFAGSLMLILTALLLALKGTPGMVMQAIRDDEDIASVRGINVPLARVLIVVAGSSIMGFAGGVYVHFIQLATPQMGSLFQTTFILSVGIIGGVRSMSGALVGGAVILALQEVLRDYPFTHMGLTALAILLVSQFAPTGLAGLILRRLQPARGETAMTEQRS